MGELQATIETSVEFHKFYNVDLFQRGFYQIRSYIKSSPKLPIKVEVSLPRNQPSDQIFPACIINRTAVTRTVQIMYRNEEIQLNDVVHFRIHALVECGKIEETLEKSDLQLVLELWYTESGCDVAQENSSKCDEDSETSSGKSRRGSITSMSNVSSHSKLECVSSRILKLKFNPTRGLHYHLPVVFDYFHLAAVSTTIHMVLSSIHQPYIKILKSGNGTLQKSKKVGNSVKNGQSRNSQATMETIFFGPSHSRSSTKSCIETGARLSSAQRIHHEICSLLLRSLHSLQNTYLEFSNLWSENLSKLEARMAVADCKKRLNNLSELAKSCQLSPRSSHLSPQSSKEKKPAPKSVDKELADMWEKSRQLMGIENEEDFLAVANSDISQLDGELVMLWNNFLNSVLGRRAVISHLARIHHLQRVKRFSEAFFLIQHSRGVALSCCEQSYERYAAASETLRNSKYLSTLPNLSVSCAMLDGDCTTLPIIFEDRYDDEAILSPANNGFTSKLHSNGSMPENRRHSFSDLSTIDDEGGLMTVKEMLLTSKSGTSPSRKPPRPSSIPAAKKFGGEDEPNILTSTPCLPTKQPPQEFDNNQLSPKSNTDSDKIVSKVGRDPQDEAGGLQPPEEDQALKHSHSCDAMSSLCHEKSRNKSGSVKAETVADSVPNLNFAPNVEECLPNDVTDLKAPLDVESGCGSPSVEVLPTNDDVTDSSQIKLRFDVTSRPGRKTSAVSTPSSTEESNSSGDDDSDPAKPPVGPCPNLPKIKRAWEGSRDSGKHSFSSSPSEQNPEFLSSERIQPIVMKSGIQTSRQQVVSAKILKESQEELSKKLEEFRKKSRSTKASFGDRPRAKSEETMIRFPGDAVFLPRYRLKSDSSSLKRHTVTKKEGNDQEEVVNSKKDYSDIKENSPDQLTSPHLVQSLLSGVKSSKDSLPPPVEFQDPPGEMKNKVKENSPIDVAESKDSGESSSLPQNAKPSDTPESGRLPPTYDPPTESLKGVTRGILPPGTTPVEEDTSGNSSTIPLRRKVKPPTDNTSASLPRTEFRRSAQNPAVYITPSSGEPQQEMETKSLKARASDSEDASTDLVPYISEETINFIRAKEDFKATISFLGTLYSDISRFPSTIPYFTNSHDYRGPVRRNFHLVVCVHGLEGNSADLRLVKTYLEMALPGHNLDFLMSEGNQGDTFSSFESMTDRLVNEILHHVSSYTCLPARISFVGHSLGCILIRSAISRPEMSHLVPRFYTYLSLSGPHLGTLYNNSGLVNMGMWFMQKWKKSGSLHQLALKDTTDIRQSFMYKLSQRSNLHTFRHVLLAGSTQDRYVPWHSARIELCKAAVKDCSVTGAAYREMVHNIIAPIVRRPDVTLCRYDIHHALPSNTTNTIIGRAAHIAVLDSELFIEKFLIISVLKYFQ